MIYSESRVDTWRDFPEKVSNSRYGVNRAFIIAKAPTHNETQARNLNSLQKHD